MEEEAPKIQTHSAVGRFWFLLLTNIPGHRIDAGSIDQVKAIMEKAIGIPSDCWWRDDLNRRLDNSWDLKWAQTVIHARPHLLRAVIESGLTEQKRGESRSELSCAISLLRMRKFVSGRSICKGTFSTSLYTFPHFQRSLSRQETFLPVQKSLECLSEQATDRTPL